MERGQSAPAEPSAEPASVPWQCGLRCTGTSLFCALEAVWGSGRGRERQE